MMKKYFFLVIAISFLGCKQQSTVQPAVTKSFANVLILGNSITYSPANPQGGWPGSWGMAASAADSDYVHILTRYFTTQNKSAVVNALNISAFERDPVNYDFDSNLKTYKDSKPDLLIMRIGENVSASGDLATFEKRYAALLSYFKTANPDIKVLAAGSFWTNDTPDAIMAKYSAFVKLSNLCLDSSNEATNLFTNYGIAIHPGNKGMRAIADSLRRNLSKL